MKNIIKLVAPIFNYANAASTLGYATTNYSNLLSKSGIKLYRMHSVTPTSVQLGFNYNYIPVIQIIDDNQATIAGNPITAKIPTLIGGLPSTVTNTKGYRAPNLITLPWRIEFGTSVSCTAATIANSTTLASMDGVYPPTTQININTLNMSTRAILELYNYTSAGVNNWFFGTLTGNSIIGGINYGDETPRIIAEPEMRFFNTKLAIGTYDNRGSTNVPVAAELLEKNIFGL